MEDKLGLERFGEKLLTALIMQLKKKYAICKCADTGKPVALGATRNFNPTPPQLLI